MISGPLPNVVKVLRVTRFWKTPLIHPGLTNNAVLRSEKFICTYPPCGPPSWFDVHADTNYYIYLIALPKLLG